MDSDVNISINVNVNVEFIQDQLGSLGPGASQSLGSGTWAAKNLRPKSKNLRPKSKNLRLEFEIFEPT